MDLNAPLGFEPPRKPRPTSTRWNVGLITGCCVMLAVVAGLVVLLALADPRGGDPYVIAAIPPAKHMAQAGEPAFGSADRQGAVASTQTSLDLSRTGSIPAPSGASDPSMDNAPLENGVRVFRTTSAGSTGSGTMARGPLVIDVSKVLDDPLGRPKASGTNTARLAKTPLEAGRPRIAIFVSGMGLSQAATKAAMDTMPAAVTLAFVPYGATIAATVAAAKAKGHEVLLQIPMRNGVGGAPGPHALRPNETASALRDDLAWLTSRFDGYAGMTNLLGAPVTADETVMTGLMQDVRTRGLFYVDDGLSRRELGLAAASRLNVPTLRADLVLDATADPRAIDANFQTLMTIAKRRGYAIGMASGLPDHMAEIARFAGGLDTQGITLVSLATLVAAKATTTQGVAVNR